jgi:ATP-binding protein involved in chromosome partitioning
MSLSETLLRQALKPLTLPWGESLVDSPMLNALTIRDDTVYVTLHIDPEDAMRLEPLRLQVETTLKAVRGVRNAYAILTADTPASPPSQHSIRKPKGIPSQVNVKGVKRIIAVASGKGGVGKSTTACMLALALQHLGWRVGVLDADIYGPSLPTLFGVHEQPEIVHLKEQRFLKPPQAHGMPVMSIGFLLKQEEALIWRGPMIITALRQLLFEVMWGGVWGGDDYGILDALIVDMPPGTGDAHLTLAQAVPITGVVIVSTPQDLALLDARRAVTMFNKVNVPVLGIIENMSYFLCPSCGTRADIFGTHGASFEAEKLKLPFLGEIPLHQSIREAADAGALPSLHDTPQGAAYQDIAKKVKLSL